MKSLGAIALYVCVFVVFFASIRLLNCLIPFRETVRDFFEAVRRTDRLFEQDWREAWREFLAWLRQIRK